MEGESHVEDVLRMKVIFPPLGRMWFPCSKKESWFSFCLHVIFLCKQTVSSALVFKMLAGLRADCFSAGSGWALSTRAVRQQPRRLLIQNSLLRGSFQFFLQNLKVAQGCTFSENVKNCGFEEMLTVYIVSESTFPRLADGNKRCRVAKMSPPRGRSQQEGLSFLFTGWLTCWGLVVALHYWNKLFNLLG